MVEQARWITANVASGDVDLSDLAALDSFMLGALAATPQMAGIGWVDPDSQLRRWGRDGTMVRENWSNRPDIAVWISEWRTRQDSTMWSVGAKGRLSDTVHGVRSIWLPGSKPSTSSTARGSCFRRRPHREFRDSH